MKTSTDRILWIDCLGGLIVGVAVLLICEQLSRLENLPLSIVIGMGMANLVYGGYSLYVTTRSPRPLRLIRLLAVANMVWLLVCATIATIYWQDISTIGLLHVMGEGLYVAGLGFTEWRMQNSLGVPSST